MGCLLSKGSHVNYKIQNGIFDGPQPARFEEFVVDVTHASPFASTWSSNVSCAETDCSRERKYSRSPDKMAWARPRLTAGSNPGACFCVSRRISRVDFRLMEKTCSL